MVLGQVLVICSSGSFIETRFHGFLGLGSAGCSVDSIDKYDTSVVFLGDPCVGSTKSISTPWTVCTPDRRHSHFTMHHFQFLATLLQGKGELNTQGLISFFIASENSVSQRLASSARYQF